MKFVTLIKTVTMSVIAIVAGASLHAMNKGKGFYPQTMADFSKTGKPFGAGVLPYYEDENGEKYVLLGREVNSKANSFAWFSGGSELKNGKAEQPVETAARELHEEAMLEKSLGLNESDVKNYIEKNSTAIMARYSRDVASSRPLIMYMVKFQKQDIEKIIETFKNNFNDEKLDQKFKEKDALVVISYNNLVNTIKNNKWKISLDKNLPQWFNKGEQKEIDFARMSFNALRSYYVPEETFKFFDRRARKEVEYHYVQDKVSDNTLQFYAQEEVKQIKSRL